MDHVFLKVSTALVLSLFLSLLPLSITAEEAPSAPPPPETVPYLKSPEMPSSGKKQPGTAEVHQPSIVYGRDAVSPDCHSETNDSRPELTYKLQGAGDNTYTSSAPTAAGVYTVRVRYPETDTHLEATATADFTIQAYITELSLPSEYQLPGLIYSGTSLTLPPDFGDLPLAFTVAGTSQLPQPGHDYRAEYRLLSPRVDLDPDSKNLLLTVSFSEGLYEPAPDLTLEFSLHADIQKAPLTIRARDQATGEGYLSSVNQVTAEGLAQGDLLSEITLTPSEDGRHLIPSAPKILQGQEDVTDQYTPVFEAGLLTHQASIAVFPKGAENLSYTGAPQALLSDPGKAANGKMIYEVLYHPSQSSSGEVLSSWSEALPRGREPGIYTLNCRASGAPLNDSEIHSLTVVLAPKVLTVHAVGEKVYDGTRDLPEDNITITFDPHEIIPGEKVTLKAIRDSSFSSPAPGTDLKVTPGNAVLDGEDAGNYSVKIASFQGSIRRRPVTVTARASGKNYGFKDPVLSYHIQGLVEGESLTGSLSREAGEDAGTYALTQGSLTQENNPNYQILFEGASFTIRPADQVLELTLSRNRIRPGKQVTVHITARNDGTELLDGGWAQPGSIEVRQGQILLEPRYLGGGSWEARYTVPKDASGELSFTARSRDRNYQETEARKTVEISAFWGSNPRTGDRILFYGTLLVSSALILAGMVILHSRKKK